MGKMHSLVPSVLILISGWFLMRNSRSSGKVGSPDGTKPPCSRGANGWLELRSKLFAVPQDAPRAKARPTVQQATRLNREPPASISKSIATPGLRISRSGRNSFQPAERHCANTSVGSSNFPVSTRLMTAKGVLMPMVSAIGRTQLRMRFACFRKSHPVPNIKIGVRKKSSRLLPAASPKASPASTACLCWPDRCHFRVKTPAHARAAPLANSGIEEVAPVSIRGAVRASQVVNSETLTPPLNWRQSR